MMFNSRLLSSIAVLLISTPGAFAKDDTFTELLDILKSKQTISAEEYQQLKDSISQPASQDQNNNDVLVNTQGGIELQTYDGAFSAEWGGRLMVDYASYQQDQVALGSGTELRRVRLDLEGTLHVNWGYELSVDFGDTSQEVDLKDAYIAYTGLSDSSLLIGQFKEPFNLEDLISSKYITFIERALPNAFAPGRNIGIGYTTYDDNWSFAAGLFGQAVDDGDKSEDDEGWGVTARVTYAPWASKRNALHLGLAMTRREPDASNEVSFSTRPESHVTDVKYVNSGDITDVKYYTASGAELAWVAGPLSLQGEYIATSISQTTTSDDPTLSGWYVYASYFMTGEARPYKVKDGKFSSIKPISEHGAWELALRYSTIDMNDGTILGGEERNTTLGVNWYANKNVRLMFNYTLVNNDINANDDGDVAGNDDPRIFQARMQLHF
ncbi:MAG TPA: porin [Gammaproteobacteria bacterium]